MTQSCHVYVSTHVTRAQFIPLYTRVETGTVSENTAQCPFPGPEPKPFDPEASALTMWPPRLHTLNSHNLLQYSTLGPLLDTIQGHILSSFLQSFFILFAGSKFAPCCFPPCTIDKDAFDVLL